jgi:hypothetical protein
MGNANRSQIPDREVIEEIMPAVIQIVVLYTGADAPERARLNPIPLARE